MPEAGTLEDSQRQVIGNERLSDASGVTPAFNRIAQIGRKPVRLPQTGLLQHIIFIIGRNEYVESSAPAFTVDVLIRDLPPNFLFAT